MKSIIKYKKIVRALMTLAGFMFILALNAQDENTEMRPNQSLHMQKYFWKCLANGQSDGDGTRQGTFEFDIMHRFGRLILRVNLISMDYLHHPTSEWDLPMPQLTNLCIGTGLTKDRLIWDGSVKYAILKQKQGMLQYACQHYILWVYVLWS